jgi:Fic family protein
MTNSKPGRGRPARAVVYERFSAAVDELANYGGLPKPHEAKRLWDDLWHLEAHHSTALEGNTLLLREVETLLEEGRTVGSKDLKDYLEVLGYGDAARWVYQQALTSDGWTHGGLVTITEVREVHAAAMSKVWAVAPTPGARSSEGPGAFREHDIRPFSGGMTPPSHPLVASSMSKWIDDVNRWGDDVRRGVDAAEVPERLAAIHASFEQIHPFIDGNGRCGRLVLNLVLVRLGWPPAIIFKNNRQRYLRALDKADRGDLGPLAELLSRSVIENLHRLIPNIAGPAKYVPLEALVDDEFSLVALKQAAGRGRLEAVRGSDGQWRSSRADVEAYKASRYKRSKP